MVRRSFAHGTFAVLALRSKSTRGSRYYLDGAVDPPIAGDLVNHCFSRGSLSLICQSLNFDFSLRGLSGLCVLCGDLFVKMRNRREAEHKEDA